MSERKWFGAAAKRKEDPALLKGEGRFVGDIELPGMLYAAFARSPFAHARLRRVDAAAARRTAGVRAVLAFADLPEPLRRNRLPNMMPNPIIAQSPTQFALAREEVCFVGEPVAVVVAESRYLAEDAAQLVEVEYERLPAVADCRAALAEGAPLVHLGAASNVAARIPIVHGDVEAGFAAAAHVFQERFSLHRGGPFFIECRGVVAAYEAGAFTIHVSSQGSHRIKDGLVDLFELGEHDVRVVTPDVGGGFGPKGAMYPEYPTVAACAKLLGRPVKWLEDRHENFLSTNMERDQHWTVEIAVDREGKILAIRGELIHEQGAYMPSGVVIPWIAATTVPGPYVVPAFKMDVLVAMTNKVACSPVRGAGRPQAIFVMERLLDRVAGALSLDPAEVRRRNLVQPEMMPYKVGITFRDGRPVVYDSGDYPECQRRALAAADYEGFRKRQEAARRDGRYLGIGIANAVEGTGLGPYEGATVRVARTGKATVFTGATPQGQSHKTTFAQVAADQLGLDIADVSVVTGDTADIALGMGTFAARSAVNAGSSVHLAAVAVADKIKEFAAQMMEVSAADLELRDGHAEVRGVPAMRKSFREIALYAIGVPGSSTLGGMLPGLEHTAYFTPTQSTYSNATHLAEAEVDIATGRVTLLRYLAYDDCGRLINPLAVEGQVVGGLAHGLGNALLERMVYDEEGQPLSATFADYLLPTAADMPPVEVLHMETPSPLNPLGVKGAGEAGTNPAIAAIAGAVEDALRPFGVFVTQTPISPERLVELLGTRQP
ncbi:MAG TPA: xanthine dehydrogenase family protein molybdopterin-binding subunit [Stellaceae bacterium]|nr:xanthine dehydrogenase family protein molybdopterin-binding subunit [Stellaceae bacterium]